MAREKTGTRTEFDLKGLLSAFFGENTGTREEAAEGPEFRRFRQKFGDDISRADAVIKSLEKEFAHPDRKPRKPQRLRHPVEPVKTSGDRAQGQDIKDRSDGAGKGFER